MQARHTGKPSHSAKIPLRRSAAIIVLLACGILLQAASARAQQSQKEYIYFDGKTLAVESGSLSLLNVNVTSPTSGATYATTSGSINLSGTLSGNSGTTQVSWTNDRGYNGSCSGTTAWTCSGITLLGGANNLVVTARDSVFSNGSDVLVVTKCTYSISPTGASFLSTGGSGSVSVSTSSGCPWTATSNSSWITVTGGSSGNGNGTVSYSVAANSGSARGGTITIAGQTFSVFQEPCPVCGDSTCSAGEHCLTCPQDCCPNCNMSCLYMCLYMGGTFESCAPVCGCN